MRHCGRSEAIQGRQLLPWIATAPLAPRDDVESIYISIRKDKPMPMQPEEIERLIKAALPDAKIAIEDLAGDGDHYAATVVSEAFRGKSRVQQHQMVYAALQGNMGGLLHALALQTKVPDAKPAS
jgi:stress-induced morphogen